MTRLSILLLALTSLFAQQTPPEPPKTSSPAILQAEIRLLKAQLAEVRAYLQAEQQSCVDPEVMKARLELIIETQKFQAEKQKADAETTKPAEPAK